MKGRAVNGISASYGLLFDDGKKNSLVTACARIQVNRAVTVCKMCVFFFYFFQKLYRKLFIDTIGVTRSFSKAKNLYNSKSSIFQWVIYSGD